MDLLVSAIAGGAEHAVATTEDTESTEYPAALLVSADSDLVVATTEDTESTEYPTLSVPSVVLTIRPSWREAIDLQAHAGQEAWHAAHEVPVVVLDVLG